MLALSVLCRRSCEIQENERVAGDVSDARRETAREVEVLARAYAGRADFQPTIRPRNPAKLETASVTTPEFIS